MLFTHHLEIMFEWERKQPTSFTNFIFCRSEKIANKKGAILPSFAFNTWCFSVLLGLEVQTGVAVGCGWILPKPMFAACLRQFSMLVWPSLKRVYICKKKTRCFKIPIFILSWVMSPNACSIWYRIFLQQSKMDDDIGNMTNIFWPMGLNSLWNAQLQHNISPNPNQSTIHQLMYVDWELPILGSKFNSWRDGISPSEYLVRELRPVAAHPATRHWWSLPRGYCGVPALAIESCVIEGTAVAYLFGSSWGIL